MSTWITDDDVDNDDDHDNNDDDEEDDDDFVLFFVTSKAPTLTPTDSVVNVTTSTAWMAAASVSTARAATTMTITMPFARLVDDVILSDDVDSDN